jgi:hypothetical protein
VQPDTQAEQLLALVEPGGLYGAEETHGEHVAALTTLLYVPTGHGVHEIKPGVLEKVPTGHGSGAALPAGQ